MADKTVKAVEVQRQTGGFVQAAQAAAKAVSFERILTVGLLMTVGVLIFLAYDLARRPPTGDTKNAEFVLSFFKDLAIMQVGALVGSMRSHKETQDAPEVAAPAPEAPVAE